MSLEKFIIENPYSNLLGSIPLQNQTRLMCSMTIINDSISIENAAYRNTTDWALVLSYDYKLSRFYDPINRSDISPEDFFEIYLSVTPTTVDLLETLPRFMWLHDSYMRRMILRNPKCIFSVPDHGIVEKLLMEYPSAFVDLDLPSVMYSRILQSLIEICGTYVKFYCKERYESGDLEINARDNLIFAKAVSQNGLALEYIPEINESLVDIALQQNRLAIQFCPPELVTKAHLSYCLETLEEDIVEKCAPLITDYNWIKDIVTKNGKFIKFFKKFQDPQLQMIAIEQDPENLQFCVNTKENLEVRKRAVQLNGLTLRHCGNYKTKEICTIAYFNSGKACIDFIPVKWHKEITGEFFEEE